MLVLVGTALLVGCGTVDLDACLPYCEGQQGYVCDEGELIPAQLCGAGESCQQGACVPHTGDDAANGADGASSPPGDGAQTGPDGVTTCTARCEGKSCGDDGCGGSCGECSAGDFCVEGLCADECTPKCEGKACGGDGCGGSCGECADGDFCVEGLCAEHCTAQCEDKACGGDGCGGTCGVCPEGQSCAGGTCVVVCTPDCAGKGCGDDGCGGSCGGCDVAGGQSCDVDGQCVCESKVSLGCLDDTTVAWLDSCGAFGDVVQQCQSGTLCDEGQCNCATHHYEDCVPGAETEIGSFDSCGVYEKTVEVCEGGALCVEGACECVEGGEIVCSEDAVVVVDSCGVPVTLVEQCLQGATCEDLVCVCEPDIALGCDAEGLPTTTDSCGTTTPLEPCPLYHQCQGEGECVQSAAFCLNPVDAALLDVFDIFGEDADLDFPDECMAHAQILYMLSDCVDKACDGDWSSECDDCANYENLCSEDDECADALVCLEPCGTDEACIQACYDAGPYDLMSLCMGAHVADQFGTSTMCSGCIGEFMKCTIGDCSIECALEDDDCMQVCSMGKCMQEL
ncbi:MAG: hypothetical protein QF464_14980, partial [Myxococcota bacterium]|nr:hypothetical protein [Myxococcota bacterium]